MMTFGYMPAYRFILKKKTVFAHFMSLMRIEYVCQHTVLYVDINTITTTMVIVLFVIICFILTNSYLIN